MGFFTERKEKERLTEEANEQLERDIQELEEYDEESLQEEHEAEILSPAYDEMIRAEDKEASETWFEKNDEANIEQGRSR